MSSTIFFFLFIPLLAFILLAVNLIFAPHNPYMEKNNVFECGFSSFLGQNRTQFSISFFIFALLFLLFDLEILLVYPYLVSAYTNGVYGLAIMLIFLLALTLGFAFELGKKALFIDSRQMSKVATCKSNSLNIVKGNISLDVSTGHISLHVNNWKKNNYSTSSHLAKTIQNKQYFISSKLCLLGNRWLSTLGMRPYSTGNSSSDGNAIFKFYLSCIPYYHHNIYLNGMEAVNYCIVKRVLEKALYSFTFKQTRFRLGFRILNIPALTDLNSHRCSRLLIYQEITKNMENVPFHNVGIEFTLNPKVVELLVQLLVDMIRDVLLYQGKKPEDVNIQISYWPLGNNDHNADRIAYNIYHVQDYHYNIDRDRNIL